MEVSTFPSSSRRTSSYDLTGQPPSKISLPTANFEEGIWIPLGDGMPSKEAADDDDETDADILVT
jgi:hypothetical protein